MKNINKTEKILNSVTGLLKAGAPDFFYTRLIGRMQQEMEPTRKQIFLLRPAFLTTTLFVILLINVFSILQFNKTTEQKVTVHSGKPATIESFANAYNMNIVSVYE
jgi:hypothetical protein